MKPTKWIALTSLLALTACGGDDVAPDTPPDNPPEAPADGITYWQDVAPIYFENCVSCHQDGGIGPFALDNYQDAKTWASAARAATASRTMPPWLVTDDDSCGSYHDSRWLSESAIATIDQWVEQGALEGAPRDDLQVPVLPGLDDAVAYSTPSFVPEVQGDEFAEFDEYRCFVIDPGLERTQFLTGYDIVPGNPGLVHHVLVMPVDPDFVIDEESGMTNLERMQSLDAESPDREGWPCYGMAGEGVETEGIPVTWAPGMGVVNYPAESGVAINPGNLFVVQMHYSMADPALRGQADSSTILLRFQDQVKRIGFFLLPDGLLDTVEAEQPATLAPGLESVPFTWSLDFSEITTLLGVPNLEIYGVFPHMHEIGRKFTMDIIRDGINDGTQVECGAKVERWDFDWQLFYFYDQPLVANATDVLSVTCDYDTRGFTEPVLPGWGTKNEMCLAGLYVLFPEFDQ